MKYLTISDWLIMCSLESISRAFCSFWDANKWMYFDLYSKHGTGYKNAYKCTWRVAKLRPILDAWGGCVLAVPAFSRSLQKTYLRGPTRTRIRARQLNSFFLFLPIWKKRTIVISPQICLLNMYTSRHSYNVDLIRLTYTFYLLFIVFGF